MTRYNRFHNQKNDSNIHQLVGTVSKVGRGQSCDLSDGQIRSSSRHGIFKNKRNDSTFNMISGSENNKVSVPITYGKKHFPEKEHQNDNTVLNPGTKEEVLIDANKVPKRFLARTPALGILPQIQVELDVKSNQDSIPSHRV